MSKLRRMHCITVARQQLITKKEPEATDIKMEEQDTLNK